MCDFLDNIFATNKMMEVEYPESEGIGGLLRPWTCSECGTAVHHSCIQCSCHVGKRPDYKSTCERPVDEELRAALANGDNEQIASSIARGANVNGFTSEGESMLWCSLSGKCDKPSARASMVSTITNTPVAATTMEMCMSACAPTSCAQTEVECDGFKGARALIAAGAKLNARLISFPHPLAICQFSVAHAALSRCSHEEQIMNFLRYAHNEGLHFSFLSTARDRSTDECSGDDMELDEQEKTVQKVRVQRDGMDILSCGNNAVDVSLLQFASERSKPRRFCDPSGGKPKLVTFLIGCGANPFDIDHAWIPRLIVSDSDSHSDMTKVPSASCDTSPLVQSLARCAPTLCHLPYLHLSVAPPVDLENLCVDDVVQVFDNNSNRPALITAIKARHSGRLVHVHFLGWSYTWDEWIREGSSRIKHLQVQVLDSMTTDSDWVARGGCCFFERLLSASKASLPEANVFLDAAVLGLKEFRRNRLSIASELLETFSLPLLRYRSSMDFDVNVVSLMVQYVI